MRLVLLSFASVFLASNAFAQTQPAPGAAPAAAPASAAPQPIPLSPNAPPPSSPLPPPPAPPPAPPPPPGAAPPPAAAPSVGDLHFDITTLKALHERGVITDAEYATATQDMNDTAGVAAASEAPTFAVGRFSTTIYGAFKTDALYDSTQSFTDLAGNALVARPPGSPLQPPPLPLSSTIPGTYYTGYAGSHPQLQGSIHDSRLGFQIRAPETHGVRVSGLLELDFFGLGTTSEPSTTSQAQFFTSAVPRVRHAYFRIETPVIDVLVGQYWHLFGWQNVYHPASAQAQGLVGELYARDIQLRLSKTVRTDAVTFEIAAAGLRPPESGAAIPQVEAGARLAINKWQGMMTNGSMGTSLQPASIAVSGNYRDIVLPELSLAPKNTVNLACWSLAADAFIPVIPATKERKANALSIHGEFVYGNGISDLYTGLTGGIAFPYLTNTSLQNPAPVYQPGIDNGMVAFDLYGNLHAVQWTSVIGGLQYYFPFWDGRLFITGNYAHMESNNSSQFVAPTAQVDDDTTNHQNVAGSEVRKSIDFFDATLFADVMKSVRVGVEGAYYMDHYVDGVQANNVRVDVAGMYLF